MVSKYTELLGKKALARHIDWYRQESIYGVADLAESVHRAVISRVAHDAIKEMIRFGVKVPINIGARHVG